MFSSFARAVRKFFLPTPSFTITLKDAERLREAVWLYRNEVEIDALGQGCRDAAARLCARAEQVLARAGVAS